MTVIAEDALAALPEDWQAQVARAYMVMAQPSPFLFESSLDEFYGTVPFAELYDDLTAEGDEYGAAWLDLKALSDLDAVLDGADELGLGRWLEHQHPRGKGGLFREVRGRRLAREADHAYRMFLRTSFRGDQDAWRGGRSPRAQGTNRVRDEVQSMVDRGAPIQEIQERLGLGTREARREAERRLMDAEDEHLKAIAELEDDLSDAFFGPPEVKDAIQQELDWHRSRLARKIHYRG